MRKKPEPRLRSGFEKKVKASLDGYKAKYKYESEVLIYTMPASKHRYTPDFILGNGVVVEAKGKFDAAARKKMALVIEQNPDRDIRMLFMRDNPITKTSKTKYSDWCEKRGVKYHVSPNGEVPEEWVREKKKNKTKESIDSYDRTE